MEKAVPRGGRVERALAPRVRQSQSHHCRPRHRQKGPHGPTTISVVATRNCSNPCRGNAMWMCGRHGVELGGL